MRTTMLRQGKKTIVIRISGRDATWTASEGAWMTSLTIDAVAAEGRMAALRANGWR